MADVYADIEIDRSKTRIDSYHKATMAEAKCAVCNKCWFYLDGPLAGRCFNGGPYVGYIEVPDTY